MGVVDCSHEEEGYKIRKSLHVQWVFFVLDQVAHISDIQNLEQLDETWLAEFRTKITTEWDFTAVHINKNNLEGVKQDVVRIDVLSVYSHSLVINTRNIIQKNTESLSG